MFNRQSTLIFASLLITLGAFSTPAKADFIFTPGFGTGTQWVPDLNKPQAVQREDELYNEAIAQGEQGNHVAAARLYAEIIRINPQAAYAYYDLGLTFKNDLHDRNTSVKYFRSAAILYHRQGEDSMARESLSQINE
jgi:tetratricopeptide (TPR) repeat protein